jgi:glycosyltransferase involved in cell wall biosynthesis
MQTPVINIVVPLFNEEESFDNLVNRLIALIESYDFGIEIILVDDGSQDNTASKLKNISSVDERFHAIFLSRNFGHQLAIAAGLRYVNASNAIMVIDGDLQDPPELFSALYEQFNKGYDVVYAIRRKRKSTILLKFAYYMFYRIMKKFSYINIPLDSSNFALMSRKVVDHINNMPEESRFLSGMRSWVGFNQIGVEFDRPDRSKGTSKYNMLKLINLAFDGIFNFSRYPIRFTMSIGLIALTISLIYFAITLFKKIFIGNVPTGFTALLFTVIMFGGLQLIAIGIIGEYILRIFFQVKNRPLFIIKERIKNKQLCND